VILSADTTVVLDGAAVTMEAEAEYGAQLDGLRRHIVPETVPSYINRDLWIDLVGFVRVTYDWVRPLAKWIGKRKCLEVMSGSGALAKALQDCGADITATDNHTWTAEWFNNTWTEVEMLDAVDAVEVYGPGSDIVILGWPYMDDTAYRVLMKMRAVNPELILLFIGEKAHSGYSVTADNNFFNAAQEIIDPAFDEAVTSFKPFYGIHDCPLLYR
jgi:hypothetical protein